MNHSIIGTLPFTSINGQQGHTQSRRNDLESLAYTIIYLALGDLPWTSNSAGNKPTTRRQSSERKHRSWQKSCAKAYPLPLVNLSPMFVLLALTRKLDYQYLHSILLQCSEVETNQPIKAPPLYLSHQVSVDREPIFTGRV
jgi:casein kinase I family protein HRR25